MNYVYTHPTKGNASAVIREYVQMVTTRYKATISFLRTDGERLLGGEYDALVRQYGITTERTAPYTLAQNGNAERSRGVITTIARAMRIHVRLLESLWPEIVKTAGYLLNRTPAKALQWKTPFELVIGTKP